MKRLRHAVDRLLHLLLLSVNEGEIVEGLGDVEIVASHHLPSHVERAHEKRRGVAAKQ